MADQETAQRALEIAGITQLLEDSGMPLTPELARVMARYVSGQIGLAAVAEALDAQLGPRR